MFWRCLPALGTLIVSCLLTCTFDLQESYQILSIFNCLVLNYNEVRLVSSEALHARFCRKPIKIETFLFPKLVSMVVTRSLWYQ
ncbi:hypothetical protein THF1A12_50192 [Vibrio jasicida]|uniref:Secreted protein n=1 Tax=Vibrio jasicida TaxID=766224 RepID=A0AAU9QU46_9VIBR|nr:hypothetical protein THF1A12_50192 [Vibrio jasicida]